MTTAPPTDFTRYRHAELVALLAASEPNAAADAAGVWADIGRALHERADALTDQLTRAENAWQGPAATQYRAMIGDLVHGVRRMADAALAVRHLIDAAAEELRAAWLTMPATGDEAAYHAALQIMVRLAERYREIATALPAVPEGLRSRVDGGGSAGGGAVEGTGLFGRLVPAGVAAASAVLGGRFIPTSTPTPRVAAPVGGPAAPAGGRGGGGTGSFRGAALPALPPPVRPPESPPGTASTDTTARVAAATGGGAAAGGRGLPGVMPPMPMGMGGMGGMDAGSGTGRRIPPWLVDTEDIWGETTVVVPGVLGD